MIAYVFILRMLKTVVLYSIVFIFTLHFGVIRVDGLSQEQRDIYDSGIGYFDFDESNLGVCGPVSPVNSGGVSGGIEVQPIVGGQSTDGNPAHILSYLEGLDEQKAANAINVYIQERSPDSPFVGLGESFVTGGKIYNVNPFLAVGHLQHENGFATAPRGWHTTTPPSHNAFGRRAVGNQPQTTYTRQSGEQIPVYQWSSWAASLDGNNGTEDPWFALINRKYLAAQDNNGITSLKIASGDFESYIRAYAPQSDGNNEAAYVSALKETIDILVNLMGAGVTFTGITRGGTCTPDGLLQAGVNGWDLPGGDNPMIYYSQLRAGNDPAVTGYFGNDPYGFDTISKCGCGPTSWAMIMSTYTGQEITPTEVAAWAAENGQQMPGCGSLWWWENPLSQQKWGYSARRISVDEAPYELRQGKLIMVSVGPGSVFLSPGGNGHLLVMRAVTDDGKFLFADPSDGQSKRNAYPIISESGTSRTPVDASTVQNGLKALWVIE